MTPPVMEPDNQFSDGPALARVRLFVTYHGAFFHGFASNNESPTVEDALVEAMSTIARVRVRLSTAGRTDAGVHARQQVISLDIPSDTHLEAFVRGVNSLCAPHIAVSKAQWVEDSFDARRSATWRRYRYFVCNQPTPNPLTQDFAWYVHRPLSVPLMNLAADALVGHHDFSAFCRRETTAEGVETKSMMRHVLAAKWWAEDEHNLVFDIRANAFCHQMVRGIVGFLVDVGLQKRPASDTRAVILAKDRAHGSRVAPAHGLVLWDVGYDGTRLHP
jgi:tRNA pseudouridine38-40 synthase